jgi:hypothetical protein
LSSGKKEKNYTQNKNELNKNPEKNKSQKFDFKKKYLI